MSAVYSLLHKHTLFTKAIGILLLQVCKTLLKLAAHSSGTRKPRLIKYLWFQVFLIGWSCRYGKLTTTLCVGQNIPSI